MGTSLNKLFFVSENRKFWKLWKVRAPKLLNFHVRFLKFGNLEIIKFGIWEI